MLEADVLSSAVPALSIDAARDLLFRHWDFDDTVLSALAGERDQNFKVDGRHGRFVLKIANKFEPRSTVRLQTQAILHVCTRDQSVPLQRIVPTRVGGYDTFFEGSMVRLLTWIDGTPWHASPQSQQQRKSVAEGHARLVLALRDFVWDDTPPVLQWDVQHAAKLRARLEVVPADLRDLVAAALERFDRHVASRLARLPRQFVHNDIQPHNILVSDDHPDRLCGILDFGDMVYTPVACDLGVAGSYLVAPRGEHPLQTVGEYIAAFHAIRPLSEDEMEALPALILARQATTLVISSWRAVMYPDNAPYILRNQPTARAGLTRLLAISHATAVDYLHSICK